MAAISHLRSLQALESAIRLGSLTAVANELGITPAAVGQRIRALEDYLGIDLLVRGRSGIIPTQALQQAMPHLQKAFSELAQASDILDFQRIDEIQMVVDSDFAELWLKQRLPAFKAAHANIRFCINGTGDAPFKIGQEDCLVSFGKLKANEFAEELFREYTAPIASKNIHLRLMELKQSVRLEGQALLHMESSAPASGILTWPEWVASFGHRQSSAVRGVRYVKLVNALEAVNSNVGTLLCGIALLLDDIEKRQLICPFSLREGAWSNHSYNVTYRASSLRKPIVQRFREWLRVEAERSSTKLERYVAKKSHLSK